MKVDYHLHSVSIWQIFHSRQSLSWKIFGFSCGTFMGRGLWKNRCWVDLNLRSCCCRRVWCLSAIEVTVIGCNSTFFYNQMTASQSCRTASNVPHGWFVAVSTMAERDSGGGSTKLHSCCFATSLTQPLHLESLPLRFLFSSCL